MRFEFDQQNNQEELKQVNIALNCDLIRYSYANEYVNE